MFDVLFKLHICYTYVSAFDNQRMSQKEFDFNFSGGSKIALALCKDAINRQLKSPLQNIVHLQSFYSLNLDIWIYWLIPVAKCNWCESFGRHDCNPDISRACNCTSWNLQGGRTETLLQRHLLEGDHPV